MIMFEQDYVMRLIKEMVRAILKLLFNIDTDMVSLEIALLFYSYLNDKTDEFLEANDFCRAEIKLGMENVADLFGLSNVVKLFLKDY